MMHAARSHASALYSWNVSELQRYSNIGCPVRDIDATGEEMDVKRKWQWRWEGHGVDRWRRLRYIWGYCGARERSLYVQRCTI